MHEVLGRVDQHAPARRAALVEDGHVDVAHLTHLGERGRLLVAQRPARHERAKWQEAREAEAEHVLGLAGRGVVRGELRPEDVEVRLRVRAAVGRVAIGHPLLVAAVDAQHAQVLVVARRAVKHEEHRRQLTRRVQKPRRLVEALTLPEHVDRAGVGFEGDANVAQLLLEAVAAAHQPVVVEQVVARRECAQQPVAVRNGLRIAHAERVVEEGGAEVTGGDIRLQGRRHLKAAVLGSIRVGVQGARHKVALLTAQLDHHWRGDVGVALLVGGVDERDFKLGHHALERHTHRLAVRAGHPAELHAILNHLVPRGADREHATLRSDPVQELELHG